MALPLFSPMLAPTIAKTRQAVVHRGSKVILRLVPELESGQTASNKSLAIFGTAVGILVMTIYLILNTLATNDAFTLTQLQLKNQQLIGQRDEVNREISMVSTPEHLAAQAKSLGMTSAKKITYLGLENG